MNFIIRLLTDNTNVLCGTEMRDGTVQISTVLNREDFHELFGGSLTAGLDYSVEIQHIEVLGRKLKWRGIDNE